MPYYSYQSRENRAKKIVLKAAPNMDVEDIKKDLTGKGIKVNNCIKMKSKNPYSFSYLITGPGGGVAILIQKNINHEQITCEGLNTL